MEEIFEKYRRPVHLAYLENKVPCPNNLCKDNPIFYQRNGLQHHFRIRHPDVHFVLQNIERESSAFMNKLHGDETRHLIEMMFDIKSKQVHTSYIFMLICIFE